jgi:hypothetical protein
LASYWNIIDFVIVVGSVVEESFDHLNITGVNIRMLRALRILRPLKAMKTVPSLRKQI